MSVRQNNKIVIVNNQIFLIRSILKKVKKSGTYMYMNNKIQKILFKKKLNNYNYFILAGIIICIKNRNYYSNKKHYT